MNAFHTLKNMADEALKPDNLLKDQYEPFPLRKYGLFPSLELIAAINDVAGIEWEGFEVTK